MEYKEIGSFLDKFKKLLSSGKQEKEIIIRAIHNITGGEIKESDIRISGKTLYIKANPQLKNEIFIKKDKILKEISSSIKNHICDIR